MIMTKFSNYAIESQIITVKICLRKFCLDFDEFKGFAQCLCSQPLKIHKGHSACVVNFTP